MKSWKWSFVLLVVAVAVVGCNGQIDPPGPPGDDEEIRQVTIPECQKNWNWARYEEVRSLVNWVHGERDSTSFLSGPGETQNTAEFHDCQRFVLGSQMDQAEEFSDGILTIFAVPKKDSLTDSIRAHLSEPVYALAADTGYALPAAQIFAESPYDSLGIQPGYSCLYLHPTGGGNFAAYLRHDDWSEGNCAEPIPISEIGSPLQIWDTLYVDRSRSEGADPMGYPVVARWIWHYNERTRFQEYKMGVWCDQAWCEVGGAATHAATPSFAQGKGVPDTIANKKQFRVNGWFDEQVLAGYDGSLFVSGIVGTLIPTPGLGEFTIDTFSEGRWVRTARVALTPLGARSDPPNPFEQKLNLVMSRNHAAGLNQIFLCRGPWESVGERKGCRETSAEKPDALRADQIHDDSSEWWGKIVRRGGGPPVTKYFSVARCDYDFEVAGTARWRWFEDDPGIWMRCINGCCEMDGKH